MDCRGKGVIASMLQRTLGTGKFSQPAAQRWLAGDGMGYMYRYATSQIGYAYVRVSVMTVWPPTRVHPIRRSIRGRGRQTK